MPLKLKTSVRTFIKFISRALLGSTLALSSYTHAITIIPDAPQINAKGFILLDFKTGKVIAEGNADMQLAPASLTKMMTSYIIGKELENGNISNNDKVMISDELIGGLLNVTSWPMMMLSGVWFSLEGSPPALQFFADFLPLTHLVAGAREVIIEGATLVDISYHVNCLLLMSTLFLALGAYLFSWNAER